MDIPNCNTSSISPYDTALTSKNVQHLFRRIGFSTNMDKVQELTNQNSSSVIDEIINKASDHKFIDRPTWADWDITDYPSDSKERGDAIRNQYRDLKFDYVNHLKESDLIGRLNFFWSNHFVTNWTNHFCFSYQFEYLECLHRNALGNFKTFTSEIGLTNAMLIYLDGAFSKKDQPNENYARELYELFTLGEGNGYTEEDIKETAKALTGYFISGVQHTKCSPIIFKENNFNDSDKTIFGRKGNWNYFDVIDILFEEKGELIATFICTKLYEFFVHPDSQSENPQKIILELSKTLIDNDFEMKPMLSVLFKSAHFFDENCTGVILKSPYDLHINAINEFVFEYDTRNHSIVEQGANAAGQIIFSPPNVAGWQRNRDWINSDLIISRWLSSESLIRRNYSLDVENLRIFALNIVGDIGKTSKNPDPIAKLLIDFILPNGLHTEEDYNRAYAVFRSNVPETYFEGGATPQWTLETWNLAHRQVYQLLNFLSKEPEFQLK